MYGGWKAALMKNIQRKNLKAMGIFNHRKQTEVILPEKAKCAKCGRRIRKGQKYCVIDRKPYCEKCAKAKKDREFLTMMAMIDD